MQKETAYINTDVPKQRQSDATEKIKYFIKLYSILKGDFVFLWRAYARHCSSHR